MSSSFVWARPPLGGCGLWTDLCRSCGGVSVDYLGRGVLRPAHIHPEGLRTLRVHPRACPRARAGPTCTRTRHARRRAGPTRPRPNNSSHGEVVAPRHDSCAQRCVSVSIFGK